LGSAKEDSPRRKQQQSAADPGVMALSEQGESTRGRRPAVRALAEPRAASTLQGWTWRRGSFPRLSSTVANCAHGEV
jgi:hypothetical protein